MIRSSVQLKLPDGVNRFAGLRDKELDTQMIAPQSLLVVGAVLFCLGMAGFLMRRNLIIMFLCTEVMFQGVLLNLIGMGALHDNLQGQVFGLFVLVIAAVEAGLGLAIVVLLYRRKGTLDAEAWRSLNG
jgi:NADH-quinone oxidoreductase subunit K